MSSGGGITAADVALDSYMPMEEVELLDDIKDDPWIPEIYEARLKWAQDIEGRIRYWDSEAFTLKEGGKIAEREHELRCEIVMDQAETRAPIEEACFAQA
eukprot:gene19856-6988_t